MSTSDTIPIELSIAERHTLTHLLTNYIHTRIWEAVRHAHSSDEMQEAAERVRRFAQLQNAAWEGSLLRVDLDAHRTDLYIWMMETESTTEEHSARISEVDDQQHLSRQERDEAIANCRALIVIDHAHKTVCERIIAQIDAAREAVAS
ncbi:MAG TPA: hypothetical protein VGI24_04630 [Solirubrobacteraceae bacterium]|jgi:hypothetical protein